MDQQLFDQGGIEQSKGVSEEEVVEKHPLYGVLLDKIGCPMVYKAKRLPVMGKVQLKLYMQSPSNPLPTPVEQYLPVSSPHATPDYGTDPGGHGVDRWGSILVLGSPKGPCTHLGNPRPPSACVFRVVSMFRLWLSRKNISGSWKSILPPISGVSVEAELGLVRESDAWSRY